jgi:predicted ArsR family transcriptional regulator
MSENQPRGEGGEFGEKVTEQDILKVFDATEDPFLTAGEIADRLPISRQAVHHRLETMREKGLIDKKKTGARGAGWWATVAPRLDPDVAEQADAADREDAVALDDLKAEFDTA